MWPEFFIACGVGSLLLFMPGYSLLRLVRVPRGKAFCGAPVLSSALFSVLSIAYDFADISANPMTIAIIPVAMLSALSGAAFLFSRRKACNLNEVDLPLTVILAFMMLGLSVGMVVFVKNLDGPLSFLEEYDEVHHLNCSQAFAESQTFSFLRNSCYTVDEIGRAPFPAGSFYPFGWHVFCALLIQMLHVPATLAANAMNYLFSSLVAPLGFALLLFSIFGLDSSILFVGSLASVSFTAFPWLLVRWGPIYPNLAAFSMVPISCALFFQAYGEGRPSKGTGCRVGIFIVSLMGIALLQPNGVFVVAVMLGSFLIQDAYHGKLHAKLGRIPLCPKGLAAALTVVFASLWFAAYKMPFMNAVTSFNWPRYQSPVQAAVNILTLAYVDGFFNASSAQLFLAALLYYGIFQVVKQKRENVWLIQSYCFWAIALVLTTSTEGELKHLIAGFWYTDHCRLAAAAAISAIPLATIGMHEALTKLIPRVQRKAECFNLFGTKLLLIGVFGTLIFFPSYRIPGYCVVSTGFGNLCDAIRSGYAAGPGMIDPEEAAFLADVADVVPDGAVVANNPYDGSIFVYGAYDIHVLYRNIDGYGSDLERPHSIAIREGLDDYIDDGEVRAAVEETGVEYVLLLKVDDDPQNPFSRNIGDGLDEWSGLYKIDDGTPGFTLILEDGEMRLYKLDIAA